MYIPPEAVLRYRAERDAELRRIVPWWRRKRMLAFYAMCDAAQDRHRDLDPEWAAREYARYSGERGAE